MRRITMWFVTTVAVVVLLFSYRTSTMGPGATTSVVAGSAGGNAPGVVSGDVPDTTGGGSDDNRSAGGSGATAAPGTAGSTGSNGSSGSSGSTRASGSNVVANGTVAQTRWGPVQVRVTISGGKITDVTTLQIPDSNRRDIEINSYAVPQLRAEVLAAQSARIDVVSGATVTSEGYRSSLQAALDSAHFTG
ncbi:FMN-binding protein [Planosporangium sp. 12N6]|uniref:FMN-binding protein n=1 Tax=Planosporangium spinosum TaxID=3402278 RepID=UPI003CEDA2A1